MYLYKRIRYRTLLYRIVHPLWTWYLKWILRVAVVLAVVAVVAHVWILLGSDADRLNLLINLAMTFFTAGVFFQIIQSHSQSDNDFFNAVYSEDIGLRKNAAKASEEMDQLIEQYEAAYKSEDGKDKYCFRNVYSRETFNKLKDYSFHYEYIGQLIYRNTVNFNLVFDTVTFPDTVFSKAFYYLNGEVPIRRRDSDKKEFIDHVRIEIPDQWNGVEFLYTAYQLKRVYNDSRRKKQRNDWRQQLWEIVKRMPC